MPNAMHVVFAVNRAVINSEFKLPRRRAPLIMIGMSQSDFWRV